MPDTKFYEDLARHAKREKRKGQVVTEETSAQAPNDAAIKDALQNAPEFREKYVILEKLSSDSAPFPVSPKIRKPTAKELLPAPFDWCKIPAGKVKLSEGGYIPKGGQSFDVPAFHMAKYSITNAQFKLFIDAGGYQNEAWWTNGGWLEKQHNNWRMPKHWQDTKWNIHNHPVVGVSWFECMAFCAWLREKTGENISLPTEPQWQRAAQGDDGRIYPWGDYWDPGRCNNRVNGIGLNFPRFNGDKNCQRWHCSKASGLR